ncbi:MAG: hypothetical protein NVS1B6_08640 [Steroidobacteraceae bacterium]
MYDATARKTHGYATTGGPDGGVVEMDCLKCAHCGVFWHVVAGSGTRRGFCLKCAAVTCGASQCIPCIPEEARIDHMEGKTTPYTSAIVDQFGRSIP